MPNSKNEILQAMAGIERIAEESNDISLVRSAYKLIRQIEEFVQQLPEDGIRSSTRAEASTTTRTPRKGKPGRKKMVKPASKAKATKANAEGGVAAEGGKKRGRPGRPKKQESSSEAGE